MAGSNLQVTGRGCSARLANGPTAAELEVSSHRERTTATAMARWCWVWTITASGGATLAVLGQSMLVVALGLTGCAVARIFNCVGWANYRHFLLFLLYFFLGTVFAIASTIPPYSRLLRQHNMMTVATHIRGTLNGTVVATGASRAGSGGQAAEMGWLTVLFSYSFLAKWFSSRPSLANNRGIHERGGMSAADLDDIYDLRFLIELSCLLALISGGMLAWHGWLVLTGQTSVEYHGNKFRQASRAPGRWS
jgi:hypothetical protein